MTSDPRENFTGLAGVYAAARPSYPPEAIRFVLAGLPHRCRVADIGCGTGISTRLLAAACGADALAAGGRVVGVDPNADMLEAARSADSGVGPGAIELVEAAAEATGLPDAAFELVTCFQSFHWFDAPRALAEFRRLLVAGGRLALVWNVRVPEDSMTRGFQDVVESAQADAAARGIVVRPDRCFAASETPGFTASRRESFPNPHRLGVDALLRRASSASYYPRTGPLRAELDARIESLFRQHARDDTVVLQQRTEVTLLRASSDG